jgi:hypothetical protein
MVANGVATCILLVAGAHAMAQPSVMHGIVKLDGQGSALLVTAQPVPKGQDVWLQYPGPDSKPRCCQRLRSELFKAIDPGDAVVASNEVDDGAVVVSRASLPKAWPMVPFLGVAAVGRHVSVKPNQFKGLTVLRGRRLLEASRTCVSQEGYHLMGKRQGVGTTHLYVGLGYDVERPTCP